MKTRNKTFFSLLLLAALSMGLKGQSVGDPAPDFTLNDINGESFTLSENLGKVVFIFFFGSECPHCLSNGPNTQTDIYEVYMNDTNFVAIGIDTWDRPTSTVISYKNSTSIQYPLLEMGGDVETAYSTTYDRIVIVNSNGTIQYKSTTVANKATTAAASGVISELLSGLTSIGTINYTSDKQIDIAPTFVQDQLFFSNPFERQTIASVELIDLTGKTVQREKLDLIERNTLNISHLVPGYYTILIRTNEDYRLAKFIKR